MRMCLTDDEVKDAIKLWISLKLDVKCTIVPEIDTEGSVYAEVEFSEDTDEEEDTSE